MNEKFICKLVSFDPISKNLVIKADFLNIQQRELLEQLVLSNQVFTFSFSKPFRQKKTFPQLKRYFAMLTLILTKMKIFPDAKSIKAFDEEVVKKTIAQCDFIEIENKKIPIVRSKSEWGKEEIKDIMDKLAERYSYLGIDWSKEYWDD